MTADPRTLAGAARHERAIERAERALHDLDAEGAAISFQAVARRAGVSRSGSTRSPRCARRSSGCATMHPHTPAAFPHGSRATEASLRQRVETLRADNQRLREENASLGAELAIAYGQQRQARGA
jgi:hypothetical protein